MRQVGKGAHVRWMGTRLQAFHSSLAVGEVAGGIGEIGQVCMLGKWKSKTHFNYNFSTH